MKRTREETNPPHPRKRNRDEAVPIEQSPKLQLNDESTSASSQEPHEDLAIPSHRSKKLKIFDSSKEKVLDLVAGQMYFTKVEALEPEFNVKARSLSELLEEIRPIASIHFNFMIDFEWLIEQYPVPCRDSAITLVVGEKMGTSRAEIKRDVGSRENVSIAVAKLPIPFGTHHTKLSILESEDDLHVIVSTANLVPGDWHAKSQCFYYTKAPLSSYNDTNDTESAIGIKTDLVRYLENYKLSEVAYWLERLASVTFPSNGDRLVYSFPGYHKGDSMNEVGHLSMRNKLSKRPVPTGFKSRLFTIQCSSIGSLGPAQTTWLEPQFLKSLKGGRTEGNGRVFVLYPTVTDVRCSLEGYAAGGSLPYQSSTANRQPWMASIFCQWRSKTHGRSEAMPHCKTYSELLDGQPQWLLMTSANLSKAAWGEMQKNCTQLMIRSYEMGVLITDPTRVMLPFDYPLVKYSPTDKPWIADKNYHEKDIYGEKWIVS